MEKTAVADDHRKRHGGIAVPFFERDGDRGDDVVVELRVVPVPVVHEIGQWLVHPAAVDVAGAVGVDVESLSTDRDVDVSAGRRDGPAKEVLVALAEDDVAGLGAPRRCGRAELDVRGEVGDLEMRTVGTQVVSSEEALARPHIAVLVGT